MTTLMFEVVFEFFLSIAAALLIFIIPDPSCASPKEPAEMRVNEEDGFNIA